jgi:hypothetical protein
MSLIDVVTLLQDTNAQISEAEKLLLENPTDYYASTVLQNLQKRLEALQTRFNAMAAESQLEVLRYRMLTQPIDASLRAVNELLGSFQQSFTVVYDAIATHTAKKRARVADASVRASTLGFAYSYAGSLGFALTLPREPTLIENDHDSTIAAIRVLTCSHDEAYIKKFADTYGLASVRTLYKWFDAIAKYEVDSEIEWQGPIAESKSTFLLQVPDARALRDAIARTSDVEYSEKSYRGTLLAYDYQRATFRFSVANKVTIHGSVSGSITDQLVVPDSYIIRVQVATITRYSSDQAEDKFELIGIEPATGK